MNDLTIAEPIAADAIRSRILTIRGVQGMLDRDLAELTTVGQSLSTTGRVPQPTGFLTVFCGRSSLKRGQPSSLHRSS